MIVRKLITLLGFKTTDESKAAAYEKTIAGIWKFSKMAALGLTAVGFASLRAAGQMEQHQIAFETMLQSGEKATKLLDEIEQFAAKTPFEQMDLIGFSKQLLAFGVAAEEIIPTMTTLGDIAAGVGRDRLPSIVRAFGKIKAKGKASMEELNMIMEAGVPILKGLAEELGTTEEAVIKMVSQGKISFDTFERAMNRIRENQFMGLMAKQSKTLGGLISNVADAFGILSRRIGQEVLPQAKDLVAEFLKFLDLHADTIIKFLGTIFKGLAFAIGVVVVVAEKIFNVFGGFENVVASLTTVLTVIGTVLWEIFQVFDFLLVPVLAIIAAMKIFSVVMGVVNAVMALNPVFLIIMGIMLLIFAVAMLVKHWDVVKVKLLELWESFKDFLRKVMGWVAFFFPMFKPFLAIWDFLMGGWKDVFEFIAKGWDLVVEGISEAIDWVSEKIDKFMEWVENAGKKIKQFFTGADAQNNINQQLQANVQGTGKGSTTKSLNVNSNINMSVPEGTPAEQQKMVREAGQKAVQEEWNKILRGTSTNIPEAE